MLLSSVVSTLFYSFFFLFFFFPFLACFIFVFTPRNPARVHGVTRGSVKRTFICFRCRRDADGEGSDITSGVMELRIRSGTLQADRLGGPDRRVSGDP